jgi:hypothetical protein
MPEIEVCYLVLVLNMLRIAEHELKTAECREAVIVTTLNYLIKYSYICQPLPNHWMNSLKTM